MKSKVIAISAISASFVAISLVIGAYIEALDLVSLVVSSAFIILPLYYNSYKGCFLSFLAGGVIAFMLSGFNIVSLVFPSYLIFFGLYPILRNIAWYKRFSNKIWTLIGIVWGALTFIFIFYYYSWMTGLPFIELPEWGAWMSDYLVYFMACFGAVFYFIFDRYVFIIKITEDRLLKRIIK